jgi:hypothetical protein
LSETASLEEPMAAPIPARIKKPTMQNKNNPTMVANTYFRNCNILFLSFGFKIVVSFER